MNSETWPALKWLFAFTPLWKAMAIIIPLASAVVFIRGWVAWRHAKTMTWPSRAFVLAALIIFAATIVEVSAAIYYYFYCASIYAGRPSVWLSSEKAIADMMLCRTSVRFAIGAVGTAFCLALALLFPKEKKK
jgi:hypothetical protein